MDVTIEKAKKIPKELTIVCGICQELNKAHFFSTTTIAIVATNHIQWLESFCDSKQYQHGG